jgi:RNA polymerase sigma-70 factor (ECF subfamily)
MTTDSPDKWGRESSNDDTALVRACQRGDREAFGLLVARHAAAVLGVASRIVGPGADAEDIAQETFVAAHRAIGGFKLDAKFSTWLYRIAVNKCTDALRARRSGQVSIDETGDDDGWAGADEETPQWALEQTELAGELDRAVAALPVIYRQAFVLRHIEGLGYDEMADIVGVHRDTLKMRVYKARTLLCQALAHLGAAYR